MAYIYLYKHETKPIIIAKRVKHLVPEEFPALGHLKISMGIDNIRVVFREVFCCCCFHRGMILRENIIVWTKLAR